MLYRYNKLFVKEKKQYGKKEYFGVVGSSGGKLVCHMCPHFIDKCTHVKLVLEEEENNLMIQEFRRRIPGSKRSRKSPVISSEKIPYRVDTKYREALSYYPNKKFSVFFPAETCSQCNGPLARPLTEQLLLFDRCDIYTVDGK